MLRFLTDLYDEPMVMGETEALILALTVLAVIGICFAVLAVVYIFQSLSLYKMASRRGINNPWLAWIPVGNMWIMGSLSDQYQYVAKGKTTNRRRILLALSIVSMALSMSVGVVSFLAGLGFAPAIMLLIFIYLLVCAVSITAAVFQYIVLYDLFYSADPNNAIVYFLLSILVGITPILLFICRNKDGGMPPRKTAPVAESVVEEAPVAEKTPVTDEGFALPEEFVEEPAETEAEPETEPEATEPTE